MLTRIVGDAWQSLVKVHRYPLDRYIVPDWHWRVEKAIRVRTEFYQARGYGRGGNPRFHCARAGRRYYRVSGAGPLKDQPGFGRRARTLDWTNAAA